MTTKNQDQLMREILAGVDYSCDFMATRKMTPDQQERAERLVGKALGDFHEFEEAWSILQRGVPGWAKLSLDARNAWIKREARDHGCEWTHLRQLVEFAWNGAPVDQRRLNYCRMLWTRCGGGPTLR